MPSPCFTPGFTSSPHSSFYTDQIKSWGLRTLNIIVFYLFADKINKGDLLLNYSCILVWIHRFSRCFGCYCLACVTGFLGPGLGPCRLRSGEKGKNFGERREPSGGLGRGKGRRSLRHPFPSSDYLSARFARRLCFLFAPMRSPVPGYLGPGSAVEEKDKERGRITGSPSSKYEHRRGIGIVIRNASREVPDRLLFFCAAFILY